MVTLLLNLGVPPHLVQAIARHAHDPIEQRHRVRGHRSADHVDITLKIYPHTNLDAMRAAVERLDDELD
jgi:hypothetical protein